MGATGERLAAQGTGVGGATTGVQLNFVLAGKRLAQMTNTMGKFRRLKKSQIETLNHNVARSGVLAMRRRVKDYHKTIVVAGRKSPKGGPVEIQPGTLRRSIMVMSPRDGTNKWMGVHSSQLSGRGAYTRSDGWFGHIVEGGDQYFGAGVNKGFWSKNIATVAKVMENRLRRDYGALINKHIEQI
jgi:hypothetical protein